ncbi:MAG: PorV/PorQ family protein [candidate division KSB1 bacterium]|nr:PorV/PorQ family protein [candidate division KSB1 bacterium]MDZ7302846.1 PorV/PorQ family protein [candidate division KSB1 bacterium]MDZ7311863.1 PorV/PorQ family protein [candidate division KSB1 bacterium]
MKKIFLVIPLLASSLFAADPTGFAFLRVPVGARPAAMAASFLAVSRDVHAIYYNPAGIADLPTRAGAFGYLNHILDIQSFFGAYVHPHARGSYGVAINYTNYGDFTETDEYGVEKGNFSANTAALYLTYSQLYAERWLFGINAKLIYSQLAEYKADGYALDLGVIYHSNILDNLTFAAGVFNLGRERSPFINTREKLPLNLQFGVSKRLAHLPFLYSLTAIKYQDEDLRVRAGGEFTLSKGLYLRLGYDTIGSDQKVGTNADRFAGISFGLGFTIHDYMLDYSLSSFGEVGSLNRLSFSMTF